MDVKVLEIVEEIFKNGSILCIELIRTHYFVDHKACSDSHGDVDPHNYSGVEVPTYFTNILKVPQTFAKRRKLVNEPIVDYFESQALTFD